MVLFDFILFFGYSLIPWCLDAISVYLSLIAPPSVIGLICLNGDWQFLVSLFI